ncbi:MAG: lipoate--protein ligase family protein [Synechococcus sp.]
MIHGQRWGLYPDLNSSGSVQMGLDRWMLSQLSEEQPVLLRFYQWQQPTLSLGHHQGPLPNSAGLDVPVVRRPTGGAAVLHGGDLCYAIALAQPPRGQRRAYRLLNQWLQAGFAHLGSALIDGNSEQQRGQQNCFGQATEADLVDPLGIKRIGSAQLWQRGRLLQHGSIPLQPPAELWQQLFNEPAPPALPEAFSPNRLRQVLLQLAEQWLLGSKPNQLAWPEEPERLAAITSGKAATVSATGPSDKPKG